jgi:hypothetical protein
MNRREAIIAGVVSTAATLPTVVNAEASENPEVEPIRALLKAHDEAFTNHNLEGVMACLTEKAAIMGTGPRSGLVRMRSKLLMSTSSRVSTRESKSTNTNSK